MKNKIGLVPILLRLKAEIVSKDCNGILIHLNKIKKEIRHCMQYDLDNPNLMEFKKDEGVNFDCNRFMDKFNWE